MALAYACFVEGGDLCNACAISFSVHCVMLTLCRLVYSILYLILWLINRSFLTRNQVLRIGGQVEQACSYYEKH